MPLIVSCKECGHILHSGSLFTLRSLSKSITQQVSEMHEGECPKCKRNLEMSSVKKEDVTVSPNLEYFPRRKEE